MRLVLDTHALLYLVDDSLGIFSPEAKRAYESANSVSISAVTLFDIGQLIRVGKLSMALSRFLEIERICTSVNISILATLPRVYATAATFAWDNRDPFDRIIMAVAMDTGASLATKDRAITAYADTNPDKLRVIW